MSLLRFDRGVSQTYRCSLRHLPCCAFETRGKLRTAFMNVLDGYTLEDLVQPRGRLLGLFGTSQSNCLGVILGKAGAISPLRCFPRNETVSHRTAAAQRQFRKSDGPSQCRTLREESNG
jgi:hypothetical protein